MSGTAGYLTRVRVAGTPTAFTNEPLKRVGGAGSKLYAMTSTTKDVWDRRVAPAFTGVGGVGNFTADVKLIDYLFGKVLFTSTHSTALEVDGTYLPMTDLAGAHSYSLTLKTELPDDTSYLTGATGVRSRAKTLKDVSMSVSKWDDLDLRLYDDIRQKTGYTLLVAEVVPGGGSLKARAFMKVASEERSGDVSGLNVASIQLELDGDNNRDFRFSDQTLSTAEAL